MKHSDRMRWATVLSLSMFAFPLGWTPASKAGVVMNLATGFDDATGSLLSEGAVDAKYVIFSDIPGGPIGRNPTVQVSPLPSTYLPDSASTGSRWDVIHVGEGEEGFSVPGGNYIFRTSVDLTADDAMTARIVGLRYAADNSLITVAVNGTAAFSQPVELNEEFGGFHNIGRLGLGLFHAGLNTIQFEVNNYFDDATPMALRLEGSVVTGDVPRELEESFTRGNVPEPSSLILCGLGGIMAISLEFRRRNRHRGG